MTTLKNAGCDIVFLSTSVRDTIITVATAKKLGFEPIFVTGMVPYMDAVAGAAGGAMQNLYLVAPFVYESALMPKVKPSGFSKPMKPLTARQWNRRRSLATSLPI